MNLTHWIETFCAMFYNILLSPSSLAWMVKVTSLCFHQVSFYGTKTSSNDLLSVLDCQFIFIMGKHSPFSAEWGL